MKFQAYLGVWRTLAKGNSSSQTRNCFPNVARVFATNSCTEFESLAPEQRGPKIHAEFCAN